MAVYKKTYRGYDGPLTPSWSRFLIIPRYAFEELHRSRFLTIFYLASFIFPLVCALLIYIQHNLSVLKIINAERMGQLISINSVKINLSVRKSTSRAIPATTLINTVTLPNLYYVVQPSPTPT